MSIIAEQDHYEWDGKKNYVTIRQCSYCGPVRPCRLIEGRWICKPCDMELKEKADEGR